MKLRDYVEDKVLIYMKLDDWEAVYADGQIVQQGHRISAEDMMDIICSLHREINNCDTVVIWDETELIAEELGHYPTLLEDYLGFTENCNLTVSQFSATLSDT